MPATLTKINLLIASNWLWGYDSQTYVNNDSIASTSGAQLVNILASSKSASTLYLMMFDATALPANNAIPLFVPIPLTQSAPLNLWLNDQPGGQRMYGWPFLNGITYAISTTSGTLTVDSTASVWVTLRYAG